MEFISRENKGLVLFNFCTFFEKLKSGKYERLMWDNLSGMCGVKKFNKIKYIYMYFFLS